MIFSFYHMHPSFDVAVNDIFCNTQTPLNPPLRRAERGTEGVRHLTEAEESECIYDIATIAYPDLSGL